MQQIFSQKLRFKADDGSDFEDWDDITLGEIPRRAAKNKDESISEVLTNLQLELLNKVTILKGI